MMIIYINNISTIVIALTGNDVSLVNHARSVFRVSHKSLKNMNLFWKNKT